MRPRRISSPACITKTIGLPSSTIPRKPLSHTQNTKEQLNLLTPATRRRHRHPPSTHDQRQLIHQVMIFQNTDVEWLAGEKNQDTCNGASAGTGQRGNGLVRRKRGITSHLCVESKARMPCSAPHSSAGEPHEGKRDTGQGPENRTGGARCQNGRDEANPWCAFDETGKLLSSC